MDESPIPLLIYLGGKRYRSVSRHSFIGARWWKPLKALVQPLQYCSHRGLFPGLRRRLFFVVSSDAIESAHYLSALLYLRMESFSSRIGSRTTPGKGDSMSSHKISNYAIWQSTERVGLCDTAIDRNGKVTQYGRWSTEIEWTIRLANIHADMPGWCCGSAMVMREAGRRAERPDRRWSASWLEVWLFEE